jgi:transposase
MSMHPQPIPAIPEETVRIAHAVLPEGNGWMQMRDELGTLSTDEDFQDVFPSRGQPAEAPWRLALVPLMHYGEGLTDRQEAFAVRTRLEWKYGLSLEVTDTGFDCSVLSEFRGRLLAHGAERRLFDRVLDLCRERGWIKARGKQRTDESACPSRHPYPASVGVRGRDHASCPQRAGRGCPSMAARTYGP